MRMTRLIAGLAAAVFLTTTACAKPEPGTPSSTALDATVVAFDPDGFARAGFAALSDQPVDLRAFGGWFGGASDLPEPDVDPQPGMTYVAASGSTGCRTPERAELERVGDDLRVSYIGGQDHAECYRPVGPVVQFAVPTEDVRGVRTVNGEPPRAATGPAELEQFVGLGTITARIALQPAELGEPSARTLASALRRAGAQNLDEATSALTAAPPSGSRSFAFVLVGCAEDGAMLLVGNRIDATLTGGENTNCDAAVSFLATFSVPSDAVLKHAELGGQA